MLFQWANNLHQVPCFPAHQLWKDGWSGVMTVPGNKQDFVTTRMGFMPQWRIWESSTNPGWYSGGCAWERAKIATGIKWHKPQEKALLTFHHQKQRCPHHNDRLNFTFSISKAPLLFHKTACGESRTPHSTWSLFTLQKPQMPGTQAYCSLSADTNPLKRLVCASRAKKRRGKKGVRRLCGSQVDDILGQSRKGAQKELLNSKTVSCKSERLLLWLVRG